MSTVLPNLATATASAIGAPALERHVRRRAFYLESQGQAIFTWLHSCHHAKHHGHGIVICPPIGHEQIHCHRSLRHLADALAQAGFAVLRPDYHGTGDSAGADEDPGRHAAWLAGIRDAKTWLHEKFGCEQVSLFGLRLGAALAVQTAAEHAVDNLVLWAPIVKGRAYVRELKALSLTADAKTQPPADLSDDIEAAGFVLSQQTAADLSRLDLLQCYPQCRRVLIVARDDTAGDTRLLDYLRTLSIHAEQIAQPGYADMMAEPHYTKVPQQAIDRAVAWLRTGTSPDIMIRDEVPIEQAAPTHALIPHAAMRLSADPAFIRERVLDISQQPNLFGILSEPAANADQDLPTIVLTNGGAAHRVGPNRLYVMLARRLAAAGFRCLRMDVCGLGDSIAAEGQRENDTYAATAFRDVQLALRYLQANLGVRRVVLMGLCSGAYVAFQSAVQMRHPMLVESVLINPLTYYWKEGMSLEASPAKAFDAFNYCMNAALQPTKWLKMLTGQSRLGIVGAFKVLMRRWFAGGRDPSDGAGEEAAEPGHPLRQDMPADLERIVAAGRQLACFFSRADPGYPMMMFHAKSKANQLRRAGKLYVSFIENANHTFSGRVPREILVQSVCQYLCGRYPPGRR
jgi:alpha-beta hydrolase superfamily lysophospholipase